MKYFLTFLLLFPSLSFSQIAKLQFIKGNVYVGQLKAKAGMELKNNSIVSTFKNSVARIVYKDSSTVLIAPESKVKITLDNSTKVNLVDLIKGKLRSKVTPSQNKEVQFLFSSKNIAMGVRGTEFLFNNYYANGEQFSDAALLEGKLEISQNGQKLYNLKEGEYFTTNAVDKVKKLDSRVLEYLKKNPNDFLPNLITLSGVPINLLNALASVLPKVASIIPNSKKKESTEVLIAKDNKKQDEPKEEKKTTLVVEKPQIDLSKIPWDIRDAIEQKEQDSDKCFYWFYKKLPGSNKKERFRRERDCDEYDD